MATDDAAFGRQAHAVYEDLRGQVMQGVMTAGERLPTQRELAANYAVSVNTVTKVISRLQAENLVWARRGAGVFVSEQAAARTGSRIISYMYMGDGNSLVPVQHAALEQGCLLSVFSQLQSEWNPEAERLFLQQVRDQRHQALLAFCSPTAPRNDDLLRELVTAGVRVIHIDHYRPELPEQGYLMPDYQRAARMAAVGLAIAGYQRLYFYGHPAASSPACTLIHRGLWEARDEYQAPLGEDYFLQVPAHTVAPNYEEGLARLLAAVPPNSGIVLLGEGGYERLRPALERKGYSVPEDVGLVAIGIPGGTGGAVDRLAWDREAIMRRAIDVATTADAGAASALRELVGPERVSHGTVRAPSGGATERQESGEVRS